MPIDALPTAPARSDAPAVFIPRADAFVAALSLFRTQANALEAAVDVDAAAAAAAALAAAAAQLICQASSAAAIAVTTYVATSVTSLSLTNGAKAILMAEAGRTFTNGQRVSLIRQSDPTARMSGLVSLADMAAKTMTLTTDDAPGSGGPYTDWLVVLSDLVTLPAATTAQIRTGTVTNASVTPGGLYNALAPVVLADGATVTPDFGAGLDFTLAKTMNGQLANPTGAKVGQRGTISITNAASWTMTYGSAWKRRGGATAIAAGAGLITELVFEVKAVSGGVATRIVYDLIKDAT